jgi:hypothetical protein
MADVMGSSSRRADINRIESLYLRIFVILGLGQDFIGET